MSLLCFARIAAKKNASTIYIVRIHSSKILPIKIMTYNSNKNYQVSFRRAVYSTAKGLIAWGDSV